MSERNQLILKHSFSSLRDWDIEFTINRSQRRVEVVCDTFDAVQFEHLVLQILPAAHDIAVSTVVKDDSQWESPSPTWTIYVIVAGIRYRARLAMLSSVLYSKERLGVVLEPEPEK